MKLHSFILSSLLCLPLASQAQIFSYDFTADPTGPEPTNFFCINNANTNHINAIVNGQGLELGVAVASKVVEEFTQFSPTPVSLVNEGDTVSLSVVFNSDGIADNTGGLVVGLHSTAGTPGTKDLSSSTLGTATSDDNGYFGIMGFNTSAGTSTKFYTRTGSTNYDGELAYYSAMTTASYTQIKSFSATNNANLNNGADYVLTFSVTKGATNNILNATIQDTNSVIVDSWTVKDNSSTYNSFDEIVFGFYGKNNPLTGFIKSVSVDQ
jgi:hypothetical protein